MHLRYFTLLGSLSVFAVGGALLGPTRVAAQETEGVEELTRGPVHEAFAETVSYEAEAGPLISTAPPAAIEEIPPESRPEGDNVSWIPGYWAWDDDQNEYLWISGIWRNLPPGREWVPGYWNDSQGQYQWISGYWADSETDEVTYLPAPPKSIEAGPNVDAPDDNHSWVPGSWVYQEERYGWRPGYWEPVQENWVLVPSHYNWTPRGYVYVDSYYDYTVARRGVIFAPVRIRREVYVRPNYYYTPVTVISLNVFSSHLFIRPSRSHYYFGDYYEPRYRDRGFYASFSYSSGRRGYDPFYAHNRWQNRNDRDWDRRRRDDFNFYRDNADARPPRTWAALRERGEDDRRGRRDDFVLAEPLSRRVERREGRGEDGRQRFVSVSKETREKIVVDRKEVSKFRDERRKLENREGDRSGPRTQASREKIAKSPLVSRRIEDLAKDEAPPKRRRNQDADALNSAGRNGDAAADGPRNGRGPGQKDGDRPGADNPARGERDSKDLPEGARRGQEQNGKNAPETGTSREKKPRGDNARGENGKAKPAADNTNRGARDSKDLPEGARRGQPEGREKSPEAEATRERNPQGENAAGEKPQAPPAAEAEPGKKAQEQPQPRNREARPEQRPKGREAERQIAPRQAQPEQPRGSAPAKEINRQEQPKKQAQPEQRKKAQQQPSAPEARVQPRQQDQRQVPPVRKAQQEPQRQTPQVRQAQQEPQRQAPQVRRQQEPQRQAQAQPRQKEAGQRQAAPTREKEKAASEDEEGGRKGGR